MEAAAVVVSAIVVNHYYPEPHMDEIFHIRQLETYLRGDFLTWDPKITTLPGLYFFFFTILKILPVHNYFPLLSVCRILNSLLMFPCASLLQITSPKVKSIILLYPPLFMSSSLFYTDTLSLLANLLYYHYRSQSKHIISGLIAVFAVFCRQTNILWIGFFAGILILKEYEIFTIKDLRKLLENWREILRNYAFELLIAASFGVFVVGNKGITVGDRGNHQPGMHLAQICYLFAILSIISPINLEKLRKSITELRWVYILGPVYIIISKYSYSHPFLLSDNTHYIFYLWKNILSPYGVYISYFYAISICYFQRITEVKFVWWMVCSCLTLVPSTLLELRYFIMPISTYLMIYGEDCSKLRICALVIVNLFAMILFTLKIYKGIGFMW